MPWTSQRPGPEKHVSTLSLDVTNLLNSIGKQSRDAQGFCLPGMGLMVALSSHRCCPPLLWNVEQVAVWVQQKAGLREGASDSTDELHHYSFNPGGLSSSQSGSQREGLWPAVDRALPTCLHLSPNWANRRGPHLSDWGPGSRGMT